MEMLDLRTGKVCKTLIPKVAEGIFDVLAVFNATNEYILYYHRSVTNHSVVFAAQRRPPKNLRLAPFFLRHFENIIECP